MVGLERAAGVKVVITVTIQTQTAQTSYEKENQSWLDARRQMSDEMDGLASVERYSSKSFSGYTRGIDTSTKVC